MEKEIIENTTELTAIEEYFLDVSDNYQILDDEQVKSLSIAKDEGLNAKEILQSSNGNLDDAGREYLKETISKGKEAQDILVGSLLPLVISVATKYREYAFDKTYLGFLDLLQAGNEGAMKAVEKFNYTKGNKLSTYATWWIRQAVTREITSNGKGMRTPEHMINNIRKVRKAQEELTNQLGRPPSEEEISESLNIPIEKIIEYINFDYKNLSLDSPISGNERTLKDLIPTTDINVEDEVTDNVDAEQIIKYIIPEILTPQEANVLSLRFGLNDQKPHTYREIATIHGISNERAKQIEEEAKTKIRKKGLNLTD